jgi:hypothetical protein
MLMKTFYCLSFLSLLLGVQGVQGQNWVPNPSFEIYDTCPNSWAQVSYALGWDGVSISPDYYNTCSSTSSITPPFTGFGYQQPHTGNAFVGISTFDKYVSNAREIISTHLTSALQVGVKYFFAFYVNLGGVYTLGSNKTGLLFSTTPYSMQSPPPIKNFAHYYTNLIITDTLDWVKLSGSFVADSAYEYLMIGNFFTDINTDTIGIGPSIFNINSYYFIDDVCLSNDSMYVDSWTSLENLNQNDRIKIYPNPTSDLVYLKTITSIKEIALINNIGEIISLVKLDNKNSYTLSVADIPAGTYFLRFQFGDSYSNSIITVIH